MRNDKKRRDAARARRPRSSAQRLPRAMTAEEDESIEQTINEEVGLTLSPCRPAAPERRARARQPSADTVGICSLRTIWPSYAVQYVPAAHVTEV